MPEVNGKKFPYTTAGMKAAKKAAKKTDKKDVAAAKRNQAAKGEFAGIVAKNAARSAKRPGSASAPASSKANTSGYNTAFVAAKKDMAAFKRNQAKTAMKKMGKKK